MIFFFSCHYTYSWAYALLLLMNFSTHSTCGVGPIICTVSVWRGVRGYLTILVVAIAKFRSYDQNREGSSLKSVDTGAVN